MKFDDLNDNLNEGPISGPAGFVARAKAKLQKHGTPFMKQQQKRGAAKDVIFKNAKDIKNRLKVYMGEIGENELSITDFLDWMKQNTDSYEGTLAFANKEFSNLSFPGNEKEKAPDQGEMNLPQSSGKRSEDQTKTASKPDSKEIPPGKISNSPPEEISDEDKKAGLDRINRAAEEESAEYEKQDLNASKGEDKEPKVDTSASIYESRFQAILEANQSHASSADGEISNDALKDDEMDTLIVRGLQQQAKLVATGKAAKPETKQQAADPEAEAEAEQEQQAGDPKQAAAATGKSASNSEGSSSGGISLDKSDAKKIKALLTKAHAGSEFDDKDRKVAASVIKYLNKYV